MIPGQRKEDDFGGDDGRGNRRTFRAVGGQVGRSRRRQGQLAVVVLLLGLALVSILVVV